MLVAYQRSPIPNAVVWPGRRVLAVMDAIVWPALWVAGTIAAPFQTGTTGALLMAFALLFAISRLRRAIFENASYHFTTWRWGRPVVVLVAVGASLKFMMSLLGS